MSQLYGGIEAGGTKWVCAVAAGPDDVRAEMRFPNTTPAETIGRAVAFFAEQQRNGPLAGIGIGSFGPVDLHRASPTWGYVTTTPKPGWRYTDIAGPIAAGTGVPVAFDNDVNVAALGEQRWGAGRGADPLLYITVGTGIGGGCVVNGQLLHGLVHPEMGHIFVPRHPADSFAGVCPYHGDCLEGLATGPAIMQRWGQRAETLPPDHPAWPLEANYLAAAVANYVLTISPARVVLGGGVMETPGLIELVRTAVRDRLNGYVDHPAITQPNAEYIVLPGLGNRAGVLGAVALAMGAA